MNTLTATFVRTGSGTPVVRLHGIGDEMNLSAHMTTDHLRNLAVAILNAAREMDEMGASDVPALSYPHVITVDEPQPRTARREARGGRPCDAFAPITLLPY
jgi:hypothetical protein